MNRVLVFSSNITLKVSRVEGYLRSFMVSLLSKQVVIRKDAYIISSETHLECVCVNKDVPFRPGQAHAEYFNFKSRFISYCFLQINQSWPK